MVRKKHVLDIFLLIVLFILELFLGETTFLFAVLLFSIYSLFFEKHDKRELWLYCLGFVLGLIIEVSLGFINRQQFWTTVTFWGVPVWLPFLWGLAFVYIRRIGNLIVLR